MKSLRFIFTALLLITILVSCKYNYPVLTFHNHSNLKDTIIVTIDSTTHCKYFQYFCFRMGLPTIGGGSVKRTYNANGKLIRKLISKRADYGLDGGGMGRRFYYKIITYDSLGHKIKVSREKTKGYI